MSAPSPLTTAFDAVSLATNNSTGSSVFQSIGLEWLAIGVLALVWVMFLFWFFFLKSD